MGEQYDCVRIQMFGSAPSTRLEMKDRGAYGGALEYSYRSLEYVAKPTDNEQSCDVVVVQPSSRFINRCNGSLGLGVIC